MNHNNGCLRKIVVACSVRNPTDSTTKYAKNLKTAFHRHVLCQYSVLNDICIIKWCNKWLTGSFLIISPP